jgi:uncharacterized membrane protein YcaP (DUF421 family)
MLDMALPWWEFVVRAACVYLVLMVLVRVSGKRTIGQFTPFDLLVVMLLSEAVSNSLSAEDNSLVGGLIVAVTLIALNILVAHLTTHSRKIERLVDGSPVLLGRDGKIFDDALKQHRVGAGEMEQALRQADCDASEMAYAFLETDGEISILKTKSSKEN